MSTDTKQIPIEAFREAVDSRLAEVIDWARHYPSRHRKWDPDGSLTHGFTSLCDAAQQNDADPAALAGRLERRYREWKEWIRGFDAATGKKTIIRTKKDQRIERLRKDKRFTFFERDGVLYAGGLFGEFPKGTPEFDRVLQDIELQQASDESHKRERAERHAARQARRALRK